MQAADAEPAAHLAVDPVRRGSDPCFVALLVLWARRCWIEGLGDEPGYQDEGGYDDAGDGRTAQVIHGGGRWW